MICTECGTDKPTADFHRNATKVRGFDTQCRTCTASRRMRLRYGIDRAEYNRLLVTQAGQCAICHRPAPEGQPLVVDHHHDLKHVRGLLCSQCNTAIGLLQDCPQVIASAASYVERRAVAA